MTWRAPMVIALVLLALVLLIAKLAAGALDFDGTSTLIVLALGGASFLAVTTPERSS